MSRVRYQLKPMNIGDILDYSVEAFKENFKGIALLSLILYVPWVVIYSILVNIFIGNPFAELISIYSDSFSSSFTPDLLERYIENTNTTFFANAVTLLLSVIQMIYSITIKLVLNAAVIKMIYDYAVSGEVKVKSLAEVKTLIMESFKFMPNMMGNAIIFSMVLSSAYAISIMIGMFLIIIPGILISTIFRFNPILIAIAIFFLAIFVVIGVLMAIAFFAVKFMFGANSIVIERKSCFEGIQRSFYLTKGKFWHIGFTCLFAFLLYYLFNSLLVVAPTFLSLINNNLYIVVNAFSRMCAAIVEPFILVFITLLFINMKVQKEGLDLEIKMKALIENESQAT